MHGLQAKNNSYWQNYAPGAIPTSPLRPPEDLLAKIKGPVLDLGCGDGAMAEELSQKFTVYAADVSKKVIAENLKRKSPVTYSVEDITEKTSFKNAFFDLLLLKYVLTSIHKESWANLGKEVFRILKPGGYIWLSEPLVSESYTDRYALASELLTDKNCAYVFKQPDMAEKIKTTAQVKNALAQGLVIRVVKHYTLEELQEIFTDFSLVDHKVIKTKSPSNYTINTVEAIFQKPV